MLLREKTNKYFASCHERLLLLAAENLRPASADKSAPFDLIHSETQAFTKECSESGPPDFADRSNDDSPPSPPGEAELDDVKSRHPQMGMLEGLKSVRKFYLEDSKPPQQQLPAPISLQDDSDYTPSVREAGF